MIGGLRRLRFGLITAPAPPRACRPVSVMRTRATVPRPTRLGIRSVASPAWIKLAVRAREKP